MIQVRRLNGYVIIIIRAVNNIQPADHGILEQKFSNLPFSLGVDETLFLIRERVPLFADINGLVLRELVLASEISTPQSGDIIFRKNDYTNSFITIVEGEVDVETDDGKSIRLNQGQFFGEMSLLSGRRRSATVRAAGVCVLLESPRREIVKLMNTYEQVRRVIDQFFIIRTLRAGLTPDAPFADLQSVASTAELHTYNADEELFNEERHQQQRFLEDFRNGNSKFRQEFYGIPGAREVTSQTSDEADNAYISSGNKKSRGSSERRLDLVA